MKTVCKLCQKCKLYHTTVLDKGKVRNCQGDFANRTYCPNYKEYQKFNEVC